MYILYIRVVCQTTYTHEIVMTRFQATLKTSRVELRSSRRDLVFARTSTALMDPSRIGRLIEPRVCNRLYIYSIFTIIYIYIHILLNYIYIMYYILYYIHIIYTRGLSNDQYSRVRDDAFLDTSENVKG